MYMYLLVHDGVSGCQNMGSVLQPMEILSAIVWFEALSFLSDNQQNCPMYVKITKKVAVLQLFVKYIKSLQFLDDFLKKGSTYCDETFTG